MLNFTKFSSIIVLLAFIFMAIQIAGCGEDAVTDGKDTSTAPALPPDESMTINLSQFNNGMPMVPEIPTVGQAPQPVAKDLVSGENYTNAVIRVVAINSAVASAIFIPAEFFIHAKENEPVQQDDGSWIWTYTVKYDIFTVTGRLIGIVDGDKTYWSMKVDVNSPMFTYKDFEWYKGMSISDNTSGSWEFFDIYTAAVGINPTAKVDWTAIPASKKADLNIQNVDVRSENVGDSLIYKLDAGIASMSYKDASTDELWDITWNLATGAGSIKVPKYNNGEKACWDAQKQDIVCN